MELTARVNRHAHIAHWIRIWNGGLQLTANEQMLLGELLFKYMGLIEKGIQEPYLGQLTFDSRSMAEVKEKLNLSKQGLGNYKKGLKEKGAIFKDEQGVYHINPKLIPQESITFKFEYE